MSRSKRFVTGLVSGYASIGINILCTIASVPLALHYLDKAEFGIWALIVQLSSYLMLLEFGMSGSVARSLSDHKDDMSDGKYGSVLRTGGRVFAIQGVVIICMGLTLAWFAPALLALPSNLHGQFTFLMSTQAIVAGIRLSLSSWVSPLWSHQRMDISNLVSSINLIVNLAVLWIAFHMGFHLNSLVISSTTGTIVGIGIIIFACHHLGFYPPREYRGHYDHKIFRELMGFGGGLFLMNLGNQLASTSQVILASRLLGVESAATWSISTKLFAMAQQFVSRIFDTSAGGLSEMLVRNENQLLLKRFRDLISISAVMAVASSAGIALMNGPFVEIWTSGRVTWAPWNNFLLACVLFATAVSRCHTCLVGISKRIQKMKYVYLAEGILFVLLSLIIVPPLGLTGLLIAALVCNLAIPGASGIWNTAKYFGISRQRVIGWIARPLALLVAIGVAFLVTRIPSLAALDAIFRLTIGFGICVFGILPLIWFLGVNRELRSEIVRLIKQVLNKIFSKLRTA